MPARASTGTSSRGRLLIADDNADVLVTTEALLKLMGFEVATAHDGHRAVELAASFQPDMVLLDIGMPGMDGFEACRRILQQPWSTNCCLVALTGWGQDGDREKSAAAGFHHHLVKPVDPKALRKLLGGEFAG